MPSDSFVAVIVAILVFYSGCIVVLYSLVDLIGVTFKTRNKTVSSYYIVNLTHMHTRTHTHTAVSLSTLPKVVQWISGRAVL